MYSYIKDYLFIKKKSEEEEESILDIVIIVKIEIKLKICNILEIILSIDEPTNCNNLSLQLY
jgi:hypothetical protein